jgi:hypothetical protein
MSNWYYYNEKDEKIAVTGGQLKWLAKNGKITPETVVETEEGKTAPAGKVKGLTFVATVQPKTSLPTLPVEQNPSTAIPPVPPNPFTATIPPVDQTRPQSPAAPVAKQSSWLVTLIGAVLIMVVGGIGWAIINGQEQERKEQKQQKIAAEEAEKEQERQRIAAEKATEEQERLRIAAEEREQQRIAAEQQEREEKERVEQEQQRIAAEREERLATLAKQKATAKPLARPVQQMPRLVTQAPGSTTRPMSNGVPIYNPIEASGIQKYEGDPIKASGIQRYQGNPIKASGIQRYQGDPMKDSGIPRYQMFGP